MPIDYQDFLRDLSINLGAIYVFAFALYYRRYGDREMAITIALLNLFLFTIVITMTLTEFNLSAGFALFAILSMLSLRSVAIDRIEVGYLLGGITLGLVNGISLHDYLLLALCNLVIICGAWILDSKWLLKPTLEIDVTIEEVSPRDLKDVAMLTKRVQDLYELPVTHVRIKKFNTKKSSVQLVARLRLS